MMLIETKLLTNRSDVKTISTAKSGECHMAYGIRHRFNEIKITLSVTVSEKLMFDGITASSQSFAV